MLLEVGLGNDNTHDEQVFHWSINTVENVSIFIRDFPLLPPCKTDIRWFGKVGEGAMFRQERISPPVFDIVLGWGKLQYSLN